MTETTPQTPSGLLATLRAAINAGALTGLVFGLVDGAVAAARIRTPLSALEALGAIAASTLVYGLWWMGVLAVTGLVLHPMLRLREMGERYRRLLAIGLGLGIAVELYWWTRPFVFYGRSSVSPERLAAGAVTLAAGVALGLFAVRLLARLPRAVQRALPAAITLLWAGGALFLLAHRAPAGERGAIGERNRDLPNVLLVVVDAMRADAVGAYGDPRHQTPVIDGLARRGVLFERALVQAPFTWPSFGSILTGKYPRRHGLVKMASGVRMVPNVTLPAHLKSARRKDGRTLADGDYTGATFLTGTLSHGSGLMQGFDAYFEALVGHELVELDSVWSVFRSELLLSIFRNKLSQRVDRSAVVNAARRWLAAHAGRRFVAMVHLYSTHTPYDPPASFRAMYCDPAYTGPATAFYAHHREAIERGEATPTAADVEQIRNLYWAGASQADHDIGLVLEELERQGVLDDTLVIVTADHGESLGEHGLWEHNHMVQTNLRVPLVMCWPGHLPEGVRVRAPVESVDILPTICDLAGLELPRDEASGERGLVDGTSLLPLVRGEVERAKEHAFAENGRFLAVQDARWKLIVLHELVAGPNPDDTAQLPSERRPVPPRLFDLEADPGEERNLFAPGDPEAERLLAVLRAYDARMPIPLHEVVESVRDEEQRIHDLGYGEGIGGDEGE